MRLDQNTILVTGGATGIGLALAQRFLKAGSRVIICGRREEALAEAKRRFPDLQTIQADLSQEAQRRSLVEKVTREYPALNVLVNNAGTQNRLPPLTQPQDWSRHSREIAINLEAPLHLSMLLIPHLMGQADPVIINVSSGLAFVPLAFIPTYCATKAALHSFTLSLRHQLASTAIQVVEIVPPAVNTDLGGKGLHGFGVPLDEFADGVMPHLEKGEPEFGHSFSDKVRRASREELDATFAEMNKPRG